MVDLTILGIALQAEGTIPVLLLHPKGTDRLLTLSIGPAEAFAISAVFHGVDPFYDAKSSPDPDHVLGSQLGYVAGKTEGGSNVIRPMTHDLMLNAIKLLESELVAVEILRVHEGVFYAELVLRNGKNLVRVDCRPSDGVALAVRCGAAIRCTPAVLEYTEDLQSVLALLPDHIQSLAKAALIAEDSTIVSADGVMPTAAAPATPEAGVISIDPTASDVIRPKIGETVYHQDITVPDGETGGTKKLRIEIRPAVVKTTQEKKVQQAKDILKQLHINVGTLSAEAYENIADMLSDLEGDTSEEARWSALLRLLSPETKEPM